MKPLIVLRRAMRDIETARDYYHAEAPHMVTDFAEQIDAALLTLQTQPKIGSPRWGLATKMAGLRTWPLTQFPYMIFYFDRSKQIEVVRVLHQASDIPQHLITS
jgi:toxin ParE1/3/4